MTRRLARRHRGARSTAAACGSRGDSSGDGGRAGAGGSGRGGGDRHADAQRTVRGQDPGPAPARVRPRPAHLAVDRAAGHPPHRLRPGRDRDRVGRGACCARPSSAPDTTADDALLRRSRGPILLGFTILFFAAALPVLALPEPVHVFLRGLLKGLGVIALSWAALRLIDLFSFVLGHRFEREGRRRLAALMPLGRRAAKVFLSAIAVVVHAAERRARRHRPHRRAGRGRHRGRAGGAEDDRERLRRHQRDRRPAGARRRPLPLPRRQPPAWIEEIGLRSTRIRTLERTLVTIPNADFAQRELENLAARDRIRIYAVLGLRYETTPDQLRAVLEGLRRLIGDHPLVSPEPLASTSSASDDVARRRDQRLRPDHRPRRVRGGARGPLPAHDRHHRAVRHRAGASGQPGDGRHPARGSRPPVPEGSAAELALSVRCSLRSDARSK